MSIVPTIYLTEIEAFQLASVFEKQEINRLKERVEKGEVQHFNREMDDILDEVNQMVEHLTTGNLPVQEVLDMVNLWKSYFKEHDINRYNKGIEAIEAIGKMVQSQIK